MTTAKRCRTFSRRTATIPLDVQAGETVAASIIRYGRMLTVEELATLLAMSPKTVYAKVKAGTMPATLLGSMIRFDPHTTAEWLRGLSA
jgi:excisionase family DNA binding protein